MVSPEFRDALEMQRSAPQPFPFQTPVPNPDVRPLSLAFTKGLGAERELDHRMGQMSKCSLAGCLKLVKTSRPEIAQPRELPALP